MSLLLATQLTVIGRCAEPPVEPDATERSVSEWLDWFESGDDLQREAATMAIGEIVLEASMQCLRDRLHPNALKYAEVVEAEPPREKQRSIWRDQIVQSGPRLQELLKSARAEDRLLIVMMLAVADPAWTYMPKGQQRIAFERHPRWETSIALLQIGVYVAPRNKSILAPVVDELKTLSPEDRQELRRIWATADDEGPQFELMQFTGPAATGCAIFLASADRVQAELPLLARLLDRQYPSVLRAMSLIVLSELAEEARPVLPHIRRMLTDPDPPLREAAVRAIVVIAPESADLDELAEAASLKGKKLAAFRKEARHIIEQAESFSSMQQNDLDSSIREIIIDQLQSHHQYFARESLRMIISAGKSAQFAKPDVEALLEWPGLDDETLRLAKLALQRFATN